MKDLKIAHWKLQSEVKSIVHLITCQALIYLNDIYVNDKNS